jgi:thiamine biosynthesis lipoprotein
MSRPLAPALLLPLLLTAACSPPPPPGLASGAAPVAMSSPTDQPSTSVTLAGDIFASRWSVTVVAATAEAAARARALAPLIQASLVEVEGLLSSWRADSEVSRFTRTKSTAPVGVSAATAEVVAACVDISARTDGAFDVTVGPLLDLWGFSPGTKGTVTSPPSAESVEAARARLGWRRLHVVRGTGPGIGATLQKDDPSLSVDVTAVTDGFAADVVARLLRQHGFERFLVDVAGEVVVAGHGPRGPWRVGINTPSPDAADDDSVRQVALVPGGGATLALSTSGTYREAWSDHGTRVSHILNPATGAPVTHALVSCTIVGADVVVADALSTACVVLGEASTRAILGRFVGYEALFITAAGKRFVVTTSASFPPDATPAPAP